MSKKWLFTWSIIDILCQIKAFIKPKNTIKKIKIIQSFYSYFLHITITSIYNYLSRSLSYFYFVFIHRISCYLFSCQLLNSLVNHMQSYWKIGLTSFLLILFIILFLSLSLPLFLLIVKILLIYICFWQIWCLWKIYKNVSLHFLQFFYLI